MIDPHTLPAETERLRRLARSLVRDVDEAEDLVQETALRALEGKVRPRTGLRATLAGVVRNVAKGRLRSDVRRRGREERAARDEGTPATVDLLAQVEQQREVLAALQALAEPYRSVLLLRYFADLPPREIARRRAVPVATVKSQLHRGLAHLRHALDRRAGDRRTWLAALVPFAAPHADLASLATLGGLAVNAKSTQFVAAGLVSLLLVGGGVFLVAGAGDDGGAPAPDTPGLLTGRAEDTETGGAPALSGSPGRAAEDTDTPPDMLSGSGGGTPEGGPEDGNAGNGATAPPEIGAPEAAAEPVTRPIVKRSAYRPDPNVTRRGGGGMGPTGHWTAFPAPPPRKGNAKLVVVVRDQAGEPVPGAEVYLTHPDFHGQAAVSFGEVRELGKTDAAGRFAEPHLVAGTGAIAANFRNQLNTRGGLDMRSSVRVALAEGRTQEVVVTLPISLGRTGVLRGRVIDEDGRPIANTEVRARLNWVRTKRDGTFRVEGAPAEEDLVVHYVDWGRETVTETYKIPAGGEHVVEVVMSNREDAEGGLEVHGLVVGPDDQPIPDAHVYLMEPGSRLGTIRSVRTGTDGRFEMKRVPDRLAERACTIQAGRIPTWGAVRREFPEGLDGSEVRIQLTERFVSVELEVVDAASGEPVWRCKAGGEAAEEGVRALSLWRWKDSAVLKGLAKAGVRYRVAIESLTHHGKTLDLTPEPDEEGIYRQTIRLERHSDDPVDVNLTVEVSDEVTREAIRQVRIELLAAPGGAAIARYGGGRTDGRYTLEAPTGKRVLRVQAEGYLPVEREITLDPEEVEAVRTVALRRE